MSNYDTRWWVVHPRWWQIALTILATILVVILAFTILLVGCNYQITHADAGPGDTGQNVVEVQYLLISYGYVLPADGVYGAKTIKAVKHFQRANGLTQDGVAGRITMDALAGTPAVRLPTSNPEGLRGMPFAPEGLSGCDEMNFYRVQAGLPDQFSDQPRTGPKSQWGYGWRESNCRNDVGNACCGGYLGLFISSHVSPMSAYRPFVLEHCESSRMGDVRGTSPLSKQKQMCVARVLYDISGLSPWRL